MYTEYYAVPKDRLKRATGMPDVTLNLNPRTKEELLQGPPYALLNLFQRQAITNPGVTIRRYHEENNHEYEDRVLYNEASNTLITNDIRCPMYCHHHVGQTCGMCGQKD
jgi:hypothetical protein